MSIEIFQETFNIKTNFLEYGGLILTIKNFMDNLEKPSSNLVRPANSLLNIVLNKDISGVSNLYKSIHRKNSNIIQNICTKWYTKSGIILLPYDIKRSFIVTNKQIDDTYLRYTQFRTLHYRYFTNDLLVKCKIQTDDMCSICLIAKDSNYHMLLDCIYTQRLWIEVELFFPGRWHSVRDYRVILERTSVIIISLTDYPSLSIPICGTLNSYLYKLNMNQFHIIDKKKYEPISNLHLF